MAANWQSLTATMTKKRGGKPVKVEAAGGVKTVEEVLKKKRKAKRKLLKKKLRRKEPQGRYSPS